MVARLLSGAVLTAGLVGTTACSAPTVPSSHIGRTWTGTVHDAARGAGTVELTLRQQGAVLEGTIRTPPSQAFGWDGAVTGLVAGRRVTIYWSPVRALDCGGGFVLSGTVAFTLEAGNDRLSGTYAAVTCGGAASGAVDLTPA